MIPLSYEQHKYPAINNAPHRSAPFWDRNQSNQKRDPVMPQDQCVCKAQRGDLDAFNELVLLYQDSVYRQALWLLNDDAAAEDACQEAFLRAYRKIDTFRGGPFRPWLLRIATNYCIDQIRSTRRRPTLPLTPTDPNGEEIEPYWLEDPADSPENLVEQTETAEEVIRSVQKLDPEYRLPLILVDLQDMSYGEAASILGITLSAFKSRLSRARQKLRDELLKGKARKEFYEKEFSTQR